MTKYEIGCVLEKLKLKRKSFFKKKKDTHPVELRLMFEELGGTFIKLGQLLSLRPDLIPREYCDELSKLQDDVPPITYVEVEHVIKAELGKPIKQLFKSFDKKPLASASIGQVHLAKLKNNKKVAVKVMRPGIKHLIETDLDIIEHFTKLAKAHLKQELIDPDQIFKEFKDYTENELDYLKEAHNIKIFYELFKKDKKVRIPKVYDKFTTHKVLTMEFLDGIELRDIIQYPKKNLKYDRKKTSHLLVETVMKQIFINGFFHADPHPANILVKKTKSTYSLGLIDFGIVGRIDKDLKKRLGNLFISLIHGDINGLVKSFISLNLVESDVDVIRLKTDLRNTLGGYYDTSLEKIDMAELFFKSLEVAKRHKIKIPKDFVLLGKALITLQGVGIELDPDFNLVRETHPFLKVLAKEKTKPSLIARALVKRTAKFLEFVDSLPEESQKMYQTVQKADITLDHINSDIQSLTNEIRIEGGRIIIGILIAGFAIGASLTYKISFLLSRLFIILGVLLLLYLLFSIVKDSFKRKKW
ncbi:MAG: AarF/ABC1/UbiB kinase family protein [Nanoarchaeota archaeon]|nr:AarF/ABC1/UbiB kinase family protein [Nanoarchaeota archaeon]MBU2441605.1 AarF/ABC1/UbiB kinase family protein [Nanoarchaeota archaeon]